jgi:hypothetical protein
VTHEEWRTIFSGFTLISVLFVVLNYWLARNKAKSDAELSKEKEICDQAVKAIERAFSSLTGEKEAKEAPEPNRLNWLTSARLILKFKELKSLLKTDLYKLICSEHEEHWRHQFYLCLSHSELLSTLYYQDKKMLPNSRENIDPRSALIIANFTQWPPGLDDPIDKVDKNRLINDGYTLNGRSGIRGYINILNDEREARRNAS